MGNKESKVLWLSQEECIEAGALDMAMVLATVEKANSWLAQGLTTETDLIHLVWEPGAYASQRIGVHSALIRADGMRVAGVKSIPSNPANPAKLGMPRSNGLVILYNEDTGLPARGHGRHAGQRHENGSRQRIGGQVLRESRFDDPGPGRLRRHPGYLPGSYQSGDEQYKKPCCCTTGTARRRKYSRKNGVIWGTLSSYAIMSDRRWPMRISSIPVRMLTWGRSTYKKTG